MKAKWMSFNIWYVFNRWRNQSRYWSGSPAIPFREEWIARHDGYVERWEPRTLRSLREGYAQIGEGLREEV